MLDTVLGAKDTAVNKEDKTICLHLAYVPLETNNNQDEVHNMLKCKSLSRVWLLVTPWTDYTVHGIIQARILEWVAVPFSRGSSQSRERTQVSRIAGRFITSWATREAQEYWRG